MVSHQRHHTWARRAMLVALPLGVALVGVLTAIETRGFIDDFVIVWVLSSTVTTSVGALILWQRPSHAMGRLLVAVGLMFGASAAIGLVTSQFDPFAIRFPRVTPVLGFVGTVLSTASLLVGSLFVIVRFPTGRRTSRLGLVIEVFGVSAIVGMIVADLLPALSTTLESVGALPAFAAYPVAAIDIALRYRRAPSVERAQFRWLIAAASVTGILVVLMIAIGDQVPWLWSAWIASTILPTIAVGVAVLRYRLYDIDRIVSRTIAYGLVTAVLFGVFAGVNLALQGVLSTVTANDSLTVAASTLAVAALFNPVRSRVQRVVDRRFNRARYDAEQTVAGLATRLRDELDLPTLASELDATVRRAIEPSSVGLWLRGGGRR